MHSKDRLDQIKYEAKKIWKIIAANRKISIAVIVALIILIQLIK